MKVRLGIDLGGTYIKAGIIDDKSKILASFKSVSDASRGPNAVKKNLLQACARLYEISNQRRYKPVSLGIGSPGTIRQPDGKVTDASPNIQSWQGTILTRLFDKLDIPVFADNDANCVALAEYLVGFKAGYKNLVFITIGTGIGGGLIINGRLHRGSYYAGAEMGHTVIKHNGKLCKCGLRGCLEVYASVPNMMKRARYWSSKLGMKLKQGITPREFYDLYKKRNKIAIRTIKENADYLGSGIGSIVNTLNPEIVVIGGGFSGTGNEYIRLIKKAIEDHAFNAATRKLKVVKARLGNNAGFVGAALLGLVDEDGRIG